MSLAEIEERVNQWVDSNKLDRNAIRWCYVPIGFVQTLLDRTIRPASHTDAQSEEFTGPEIVDDEDTDVD